MVMVMVMVMVMIMIMIMVIFKKITTFFNLKDMFRCYEHHRQLHNV